jgi:hypothetical protein
MNLVPNSAYLVYSTATTNYTWTVMGQPVGPNYSWTGSGLNFVGFPTPAASPPMFDSFISLGTNLQSATDIFQYPGGPLGPSNPSLVFALHTTPVTRGQAFWIRTQAGFNNYFGPFQAVVQGSSGVNFGDSSSQFSLQLQNVTATNVTVFVKLLASANPPAGQTPIAGVPPLLLRGALNTSTLVYGYTNLPVNAVQSFTLAPVGQPGASLQVVFGVNRYQMTGSPGALFAGILEFTDGFGFSQVDLPVSALQSSTAGLWVGSASVTQVGNYLKTFQTDNNNNPVVSSNGNYVVTGINTNLGPVPQPYPLRLIIHNDGSNVRLLQRVFYGLRYGTNQVIATQEAFLDATNLATARRISAVDLPYSDTNAPWAFSGQLVQGAVLTTTVNLDYGDQRSNPFLHTYHPDHDNLDASFQNQLARGMESYDISRQITLNINPPGNDFASLTSSSQSLSGTYLETITLNGQGSAFRTFNVTGVFSLNRISTIPTLTQQ